MTDHLGSPGASRARVVRSSNNETIGLRGAAFVVLDKLFSRARLGQWINEGKPAGHPGLSEAT